MVEPVSVSVDGDGNVNEAAFDGQFVNEYRQASNKVVTSCTQPGLVSSVSVDKDADVVAVIDYRTGKIVSTNPTQSIKRSI
jgi:hypothetical protein